MGEISEQMRAYRDALDRHGIPWADETTVTEAGGFLLHLERTVTHLDGERASVIWGYQRVPDGARVGISMGWPALLEVWYKPIDPEPRPSTSAEILHDVFGVREGSR